MTRFHGWSIAGLVAAALVVWSWTPAGADSSSAATAQAPATQPATMPSSEQVMHGMEKLIDKNPAIAPSFEQDTTSTPLHGLRTASPVVIGTAPGEQPSTLRREGEFVVNRLGRLMRDPTGAHSMFVFEADSQFAPEPPMILEPCEALQTMEDLVKEKGDRIVFKLSGQILTYRGANYLLPTTMMLVADKGNLTR